MKKNKKHRLATGKHCINLYFDQESKDAGCFIIGSHAAFKAMLISAAIENPTFGQAFLDAALEYANKIVAAEDDADA